MGNIHQEAHVKRSSSTTFALRWKHEKWRLISQAIYVLFAITFMFLVLLYGTATKSVSVVVNGQERFVETRQWVLERLLDEQAIQLNRNDYVSKPLSAAIHDGEQIVIDLSKTVTLKVDGKTRTLYTTENTVQQALDKWEIALGSLDQVVPAASTALKSGTTITITRITQEVVQLKQSIPFKLETRKDATLYKGKYKLLQAGKNGVVAYKVEKTFEDGKFVSKKVIGQSNLVAVQPKVVAVGTKAKPVQVASKAKAVTITKLTKKGVTFGVKKTLKNVELSAYTANVGKGKNNGITASGTRVQEGRTIAVDPKIVPLGWWVYIEGIGFRRAEDTGGAIKGHKMDVFFESEKYALRFGRQHGFTVYIIGPVKPEFN